ncbi:hypothetical protein D3C81_901370 [compost metagenome]
MTNPRKVRVASVGRRNGCGYRLPQACKVGRRAISASIGSHRTRKVTAQAKQLPSFESAGHAKRLPPFGRRPRGGLGRDSFCCSQRWRMTLKRGLGECAIAWMPRADASPASRLKPLLQWCAGCGEDCGKPAGHAKRPPPFGRRPRGGLGRGSFCCSQRWRMTFKHGLGSKRVAAWIPKWNAASVSRLKLLLHVPPLPGLRQRLQEIAHGRAETVVIDQKSIVALW